MLVLSLGGCGKREAKQYTKTFIALGTAINFNIFSNNEKEAQLALEEGIKKIKEIENKMSVNIKQSEISTLNTNGQSKVSDETFYVIKNGLKYSKLAKGKFDITVEPLVRIWGIGTEHARIPNNSEISNAKKLINYNNVSLDEKNNKVTLGKSQQMDLGAIAKGYTADEVKKVFLKHNIKSGTINLGGNVMTIGNKVDGSEWKIGMQNPFGTRDDCMGIVYGKNLSVVTSGNYERYFEKDGVRYHHILDIDTGYPSKSEVISATIISENGIDGDALSTTVYILGVEKGLELIEELKGIDAILITKDRKVYVTKNIKNKFEIIDESFKLVN
ncbi:thiamine biosynthesis protein ApbE [Clostridium botulinum]|uniref:FAD:protein FMN transferase n=2 Tax=Clostridium botulinum TaxID=1491 RepID=A0A9Q1ZCP8_CLOBO|nr:thiamine biosynthesis protein ApbE [Clostridium botulinum V891]KOA77321.1 thiamine biosynthesis protein ApbE [Clostridium botulinum]KOA79472.1 thiamine biosynthesis protein ApbE [Clostridium botulinum]KOA84974.1 thiamine biosynthesis protein ApbE [Clostridium botulinum]KOA85525.1 thiamine biosynthesis protein ApbE [Clostridium botulinum]